MHSTARTQSPTTSHTWTQADEVVALSRTLPMTAYRPMLDCLRRLGQVESSASLRWLDRVARWAPPQPHPYLTLYRDVAAWSLGRRAKAGSTLALMRLFRLVDDPLARGPAQRALNALGFWGQT